MINKETVERYEWYILNAMRFKIQALEKSIADGKESMKHDDSSVMYRSMENMISYCEQSLMEYTEALKALEKK
jgi:hypothetical protein